MSAFSSGLSLSEREEEIVMDLHLLSPLSQYK
jgi:hypothetical protein